MARVEISVEMKGIHSFQCATYTGYGTETRYIYNMIAADGTVYVWKTTAVMQVEEEPVNTGDKLVIIATVKGTSEYKGQPQTELSRVKVKERSFRGKTWEEIQREKEMARDRRAQEQRDSLTGKDFIWRMPYKQYKEHYSDCETVVGSYTRDGYVPSIEVIIREGRLKASGVRGEHFSGYILENEEGKHVGYRAVCEENAIRRAEKEFGGVWKCVKIYM